ncbi:hypothetical protein ANN_19825 [Periplaneta americana]|uniref:RNase H type-1 domain-containing protein n=1 Tax=Periplaneta americana TaxID=6978 RepID=A0ABQ8SBC0_PERAM|nr:hypothetical protein ANN_19825 [Periplaneta americana]
MEHVKWTDRIRNETVLERVGEERMMLKLIRKRKRTWLGHWLRRNCILKDALEECRFSSLCSNVHVSASYYATLVKEAKRKKWKIEFNWIKAHAGHEGNELADQFAKEAARSEDIPESYSKTPKSAVKCEIHTLSLVKWQNEWDNTAKGQITKSFFPNINDRLKLKLNITPNFTTIITGHGNIKSYLHKYKIIDSPLCPCNNDEQIIDHLLYNCKLLERERDILKAPVLKSENWPIGAVCNMKEGGGVYKKETQISRSTKSEGGVQEVENKSCAENVIWKLSRHIP